MLRFLIPLLVLVACTGNEAAPDAASPETPVTIVQQASQSTSMTGYGTTPHVKAYSSSVLEGDSGKSQVTMQVTLSPRVASPVVVDYLTEDGSAREGYDYHRGKGRVTFKPGVTDQEILLDIIGDEITEDDETFTLRLHVPDYARLDTDSVTITIVDDD